MHGVHCYLLEYLNVFNVINRLLLYLQARQHDRQNFYNTEKSPEDSEGQQTRQSKIASRLSNSFSHVQAMLDSSCINLMVLPRNKIYSKMDFKHLNYCELSRAWIYGTEFTSKVLLKLYAALVFSIPTGIKKDYVYTYFNLCFRHITVFK